MLDHLIALLDDSNDFSWSAAKASHAVLLCRMEQGEMSDYTQTDLVDRVRRAHAQRHIVPTDINQQVQMVEAQINEEIIGDQGKNIPKEVWQNRFTCVDYNACVEQNGSDFGYIPLTDLQIYKGPLIQ